MTTKYELVIWFANGKSGRLLRMGKNTSERRTRDIGEQIRLRARKGDRIELLIYRPDGTQLTEFLL